MNNLKKMNARILAKIGLGMTTVIVNSTCGFIIHQEPLPESAKRLRKF